MNDNLDAFRLDRTHLSVVSMHDPDDTTAYWFTRPVEERLAALEFLRQQMYGHDPLPPDFKEFLR